MAGKAGRPPKSLMERKVRVELWIPARIAINLEAASERLGIKRNDFAADILDKACQVVLEFEPSKPCSWLEKGYCHASNPPARLSKTQLLLCRNEKFWSLCPRRLKVKAEILGGSEAKS